MAVDLEDFVVAFGQTAADPIITAGELEIILELAKRPDVYGLSPIDTGWTETYDKEWAVAECWKLKAAKVANNYQFDHASGESFNRQQIYDHCVQMDMKYRPTGYIKYNSAESVSFQNEYVAVPKLP